MKVLNATDGEGLGLLAANGGTATAIKKALDHTAGPTLIECTIDRNDCTKQLLEWGTRVATATPARSRERNIEQGPSDSGAATISPVIRKVINNKDRSRGHLSVAPRIGLDDHFRTSARQQLKMERSPQRY